MVKKRYELGELEWMLAGWTPYVWRQQLSIESGVSLNAEVTAVPARVPGSVQAALRDAGLLPDWDVGLNARECEWVENRHWIYTARLPDTWLERGRQIRLHALGVDYAGWVLLNGGEIDTFEGSLIPHVFDLTPYVRTEGNTLQLVFDCPPRWLGQIGYTSKMRQWKERFNYFWDWTSRLVQLGIWDDLFLEVTDGQEIGALHSVAHASLEAETGTLELRAEIRGERGSQVSVSLERDGAMLREERIPCDRFGDGVRWDDLPVELWWPNGAGAQPLYTLHCRLLDADGAILDDCTRRVGFRDLRWEPCGGAPVEADPWLCVANGRPLFLQGVNWTPILPNFADVTPDDYRRLLRLYRDLGCNVLRVWGGAFLEKEIFYDLCDELGLLVWQEFPLSSSGLDNYAPDDPASIEALAEIAASYVERRRHHVSLLLWCGGNELQGPRHDGQPGQQPLDFSHQLIKRLAEVVAQRDPGRRFLPTSPSGPSFGGEEEHVGEGRHWDVHGPWHVTGDLETDYRRYWEQDDSLFRSEVGVAGASPVDLIREYRGDLPETPGTLHNPLWRRSSWWIDWPVFVAEQGREPESLEEFVSWSQERQRRALGIAARACKDRFPRCGGFIIWMGHDCFPCTANTAIVDFHGRLKPAAIEISSVFLATPPPPAPPPPGADRGRYSTCRVI